MLSRFRTVSAMDLTHWFRGSDRKMTPTKADSIYEFKFQDEVFGMYCLL